ncbi:MAG: ATP-binding protein [Rhodospirillaceae bacterium]|nr:ATP-binding protein [Rhodospirillaceae bacterium]
MNIYKKYILATLPIVLLGTGLLGYWSYSHSRDALYRTEQEILTLQLNEAINQIVDRRFKLLNSTGLSGITSFVKRYKSEVFADLRALGHKTDRRIFIIDSVGEVIFCSDCNSNTPLSCWSNLALKMRNPTSGTHLASKSDHAIFAAAPYRKPNWDWVIFITRTESEISNKVDSIAQFALMISLLSTMSVAIILASITRHLLVKPILKLQAAASIISRRRTITEIDIKSDDELGHLARDVEKMSQSIAEYVDAADAANQAKSNFLATMSHELRTPLNGVLGLAQLLQKTPLDRDQKKNVDAILSSGQTLLSVISDVLDMSRIEAGGLQLEDKPFNLNDLISTVVTPFQSLATKKGLKLSVTKTLGDLDALTGDSVRLRQILWNLSSNGIKFTDEGQVTLEIREIDRSSENILIAKDRVLHFVVSDTGCGISEDRIDAIFDAFTQEDSSIARKFGGTGLGLSIVKQLTELMGGSITGESHVGKGTRFDIFLPFHEAALENSETLDQGASASAFADMPSLNILLAEDNDVNAMIATAFLENLGHNVRHVENGQLAVTIAQEDWADMIMMDIHMPEMDGIEATKRIRQSKPRGTLPIIGLTAEAFVERHDKFIEDGMDFVLTKPFTEQQMAATIARYRPSETQRTPARTEPAKALPCAKEIGDAQESLAHQSVPIGDDSKLDELSQKIDEDTLATLLTTSEECLEERVVKLRAGVNGSDSDAIYAAAHSMKGACGSMFGVRMSALAAVVEENSQDLNMTRELLPEIEKTATETISWWRSKRMAS